MPWIRITKSHHHGLMISAALTSSAVYYLYREEHRSEVYIKNGNQRCGSRSTQCNPIIPSVSSLLNPPPLKNRRSSSPSGSQGCGLLPYDVLRVPLGRACSAIVHPNSGLSIPRASVEPLHVVEFSMSDDILSLPRSRWCSRWCVDAPREWCMYVSLCHSTQPVIAPLHLSADVHTHTADTLHPNVESPGDYITAALGHNKRR
ncbi:hypothetical protein F4813DRAFT_343378 [Daldinia decipiens]|uniref:uncharacterized protein n=1 Tax=Daldinia decipiens TaxID=326647 RepID=UPI0020C551E2|nr:uncharacterized protein F4813DRAFT_343378 [Daldinia decipiens]KAI1662068.1 hypothetical protein F4813DRAFT_343378 [Daldinia decipiens]